MLRTSLIALVALACLVAVSALATVPLPIEEFDPFGAPCSMSVTENGGTRTLSWDAVGGASFYAVGRRTGSGDADLIAQTTGTSVEDKSFDPDLCYEYIFVAYDDNAEKVCSGHVEDVGNCGSY
jgi:hypothetical protein